MTRKTRRRMLMVSWVAPVAMLSLLVVAGSVQAAGLTYLDADDGFGGPANIFPSAGGNLADALDSTQATNGDNKWGFVAAGSGAVQFVSNTEDSPELRMHASAPNGSYDVYVAYWSASTAGQQIRAGVTSNPGANPTYNRTTGTLAAAGAWMVKPSDNSNTATDDNGTSSTVPPGNQTGGANGAWTVNPDPFYEHLPGSGGGFTFMYLARVNAAGVPVVAAGGAGFDIFVDDGPSAGGTGGDDTRWDGLAYVPVGTPVFVTASVNRDTGNLTISNPTINSLPITSYSIGSVSGSLDSTTWHNITNNTTTITQTGWSITEPTPPPTAVSATFLTETGPSANFVSTTGALDLGNVWRRSSIQDVRVTFQLADGSTVRIDPTYTGTALALGDFDGNGVVGKPDFVILMNNLHTNVAGQTVSQTYLKGDITQNGSINRDDFVAFRNTYCSLNTCSGSGAGSFAAQMGGIVPEPSAWLLLALGSACLLFLRRGSREPLVHLFQGFATMLQGKKLKAATVALTAIVSMLIVETSAQAAVSPVVNWRHWTSATADDTDKITNPTTNSPTFGDGSANHINNYQGYGVTADGLGNPQNVTIQPGESATLTGKLRIVNATNGNIPAGDVRLGIWNKINNNAATGKNGGWQGYMAVIASGAGTGHLEVRNPDDPDWRTGNFISDAGGGAITTVAGGAPTCAAGMTCDPNPYTTDGVNVVFNSPGFQRYARLASGNSIGNVGFQFNQDYQFTFKVGRFGTGDYEVSASIVQTSLTGDYNSDGSVNAADYTVWRDHLGQNFALPNRATANTGAIAQADYTTWVTNFGTQKYTWNIGGGTDFDGLLPLRAGQTTFTSHLTDTFNRVGFLFGGGTGADQALMNNVQFGTETIQTLTLQVNTTTGAANIKNGLIDPKTIDYYEIASPTGSLIKANWTGIDGTAASAPDGNGWDAAGGSTNNILSEGNLTGSLTLAPGASTIGLGNIFILGSTPAQRDLRFSIGLIDGSILRGNVNYGALPGAGSGSAVPEPATIVFVITGFGMVLANGRRRS